MNQHVAWEPRAILFVAALAFYLLLRRPATPGLWDWCLAYRLCAVAVQSIGREA